MDRKFRALRIVALLYKIFAWIVLIGGLLAAIVMVAIGAIQGSRGVPSPILLPYPMLSDLTGPLAGLVLGAGVLLITAVYFLILLAGSEVIHLGLAIEHNTRETAYYLRGEGTMPPPPPPVSWDTADAPGDQAS